MKWISLATVMFFIITSCAGGNSVRLRNDHDKTLKKVKIGDVDFGTVTPYSLSNYKAISAGEYKITSKGRVLANFSLPADGRNYTVVINDQGEIRVSLSEFDLFFY